jgi:NAD(P)-dependent dehydrogenase (short-subunit alcohol dehydrogenase family)
VGRTVAEFGALHAVVHAACSYIDGGGAAGRADWHRSLDVNVVGAALLVKEAVPHLARHGGTVVLIGSISAKVAQAGRWLYPAGKAALLQLARSMALDLAGSGIRVNSLSPGKTWSAPLARKYAGDRAQADEAEAAFHIMGRLADAGEVARAALFLCSDAASFITGTDLAVDGGYSAMGPERMQAQQVLSHRDAGRRQGGDACGP